MTTGWGSLLAELVPLGLVIALSPLTIIPAVLALDSARPRPTGLAFLGGWVLGLGVLTSIFVAASGLVGSFDEPPGWAAWLRVVVGAALIVFGGYRFATRNRSEHSPAWMRKLTGLTPGRAAATAAVLVAVNPKVLFMCIAAGLAIGSAGVGLEHTWWAVPYFVAVAAATVALPVLGYLVSGDRLAEPLARHGSGVPASGRLAARRFAESRQWLRRALLEAHGRRGIERLAEPLARLRRWMEEQHAVLVAGILVIIGIMVLYKGIHGL
jgi:threonine/homoserine/homoserine lactone efflux protein